MNVLFVSISSLPHMSNHSISLDLLHKFRENGHDVYVVCAIERKSGEETFLSKEAGCVILRVKIGNNKKASIIEKGLTTVMMPRIYNSAIKKYYSKIKFDLVIYPTPPVTVVDIVRFVKRRDGAKSYLLLKDIFPQNAVDIGIMDKSGVKGILYRYFRNKEKKLYALSDFIGCMSQANVDYIIKNNGEIKQENIEICPNSIEVFDFRLKQSERDIIREKYRVPLDSMVFIYGGNLGKPQGIPFLIECLRYYLDDETVYFLIIGDGTEFREIERFFEEKKPKNMQLIRRLPKEDYDQIVAAADVGMIFLDYRFTIPNFPSRLLSYMQAGIPVLACTDRNTDIGKVIVEGGFGWWCESKDAEKFSELVKNVYNCNLKVMGDKGYQYLCRNYNVNRCYEVIINKIC